MKRDKSYVKWREAVIKRDKECVICGAGPKYLNIHHIIPKNFTKFALNIANGITLCPHHHTLGKWSAHKNPIWFSDWLEKNRKGTYWLARDRLEEESEV